MKVDVWYDVVCPWCWLGKARLDVAIGGRTDVDVVTHSFELDPEFPKDLDISTTELVTKKFGMGRAQVDALHERIGGMGREVGIAYAFDRVRTSNTFEAHQLVHLARAAGGEARANAMIERLFRANFHEGLRIGSRDVLVELGKEVGLDRADVAMALESARHANAVLDDEGRAKKLGVSGVPFFLIDGRVRVSGAQSVEVLRDALEQAQTRSGALR